MRRNTADYPDVHPRWPSEFIFLSVDSLAVILNRFLQILRWHAHVFSQFLNGLPLNNMPFFPPCNRVFPAESERCRFPSDR